MMLAVRPSEEFWLAALSPTPRFPKIVLGQLQVKAETRLTTPRSKRYRLYTVSFTSSFPTPQAAGVFRPLNPTTPGLFFSFWSNFTPDVPTTRSPGAIAMMHPGSCQPPPGENATSFTETAIIFLSSIGLPFPLLSSRPLLSFPPLGLFFFPTISFFRRTVPPLSPCTKNSRGLFCFFTGSMRVEPRGESRYAKGIWEVHFCCT